ncbi:hypothetical protein EVAR_80787_1 [Eumeta japonica]|uniref:Uncharacterized protein n=1 Tax=Eumeta variegata TaxID=151549 RepID=A0A4C1WFE8_EUMVA|nr:hypothetical protein EVAR_80787_1 [Eumeta japonica]
MLEMGIGRERGRIGGESADRFMRTENAGRETCGCGASGDLPRISEKRQKNSTSEQTLLTSKILYPKYMEYYRGAPARGRTTEKKLLKHSHRIVNFGIRE